jgi:adenylate cyclase
MATSTQPAGNNSEDTFGELIPVGGGDTIPLFKKHLLIGRRESCDIILRFKNVSAHHCQLIVKGGYWYVKDMKSLNGVKVNGARVSQKRVDPGDKLTIAKHSYQLIYAPHDLGAVGPPPPDEPVENILNESLLSRAGLENSSRSQTPREDPRQKTSQRSTAKQKENRPGSS